MNKNILAITVSYQPDLVELCRQLDVLIASQVSIVIIDNDSANFQPLAECLSLYSDVVTLHRLPENMGIAAAQNYGIRMAIEQGYKYVLLMDQDSLPAADMVEALLRAIDRLDHVAAVGPNYVDPEQRSRARFIRVDGLRIKKFSREDGLDIVEVDHLIASGSLIPTKNFELVGLMDESLFIDYVDIDWALRARSKGLLSYGVFSAQMYHNLGDDNIHFAGRNLAIHSPRRHYFLVRNALRLYKRNYIPLSWKIVDAYKLLLKLSFLLLFSDKRWRNMKAIIQGGIHGVSNKSNKNVKL